MNRYFTLLLVLLTSPLSAADQLESNKQIAADFYRELWFTNNTDSYAKFLADEYVVHDDGDQKNVTEPAIVQKEIADFFWSNGDLSGQIDYQLADRDLVATRWQFTFTPTTLFGHLAIGEMTIPIINVFRIEGGKITEIWNHRHDIDIPGRTRIFVLQGFAGGLVLCALLGVYTWRLRKKLAVKAESF